MFDGMTVQKVSGIKAEWIMFDELGPVTEIPSKYLVEWKDVTYKDIKPVKSNECFCFKCKPPKFKSEPYVPVKAFEILKDKKSWVKLHMEVTDQNGYTMRCIMGALQYKWMGDPTKMTEDARKVYDVLHRKYGVRTCGADYSRVVALWNDNRDTTHKMVIEVLKEANV